MGEHRKSIGKPKSDRIRNREEKGEGFYIEDESLVGGLPGETAEEVDTPDQHHNRSGDR